MLTVFSIVLVIYHELETSLYGSVGLHWTFWQPKPQRDIIIFISTLFCPSDSALSTCKQIKTKQWGSVHGWLCSLFWFVQKPLIGLLCAGGDVKNNHFFVGQTSEAIKFFSCRILTKFMLNSSSCRNHQMQQKFLTSSCYIHTISGPWYQTIQSMSILHPCWEARRSRQLSTWRLSALQLKRRCHNGPHV